MNNSGLKSPARLIAVSGVKNSGKTTLLSALIPVLKNKGLKVGLIKHDGHDFLPDVPGSDSFKLRQAGADPVAVYSPKRYMLTVETNDFSLDKILPHFEGTDLILLEGGKAAPWPKIEVLRGKVSQTPVCDPETLLAIYTDTGISLPGVPAVGFGDILQLADIIMSFVKKQALLESDGQKSALAR